jgi:hypothetical protein
LDRMAYAEEEKDVVADLTEMGRRSELGERSKRRKSKDDEVAEWSPSDQESGCVSSGPSESQGQAGTPTPCKRG